MCSTDRRGRRSLQGNVRTDGKYLCNRPTKQTTIGERGNRFIHSLVDPDAPPYGSASLCEFGYGLRPSLWMTRGSFGKTTIGERANRFIHSLVDPDAPPYGSASLFEFGYGLRPPLRMTRGSFGKTTIVERAGSWRCLTACGSCFPSMHKLTTLFYFPSAYRIKDSLLYP